MSMATCNIVSEEDEDGYSSITGLTLLKAIDELKENPATRSSTVKEFREKILQRESELQVWSEKIVATLFLKLLLIINV